MAAGEVLRRPRWWSRLRAYAWRQSRRLGRDLLRSRGRVHKLTFFAQNFMDAQQLDEGRIHACSFMVITDEGPVSMCRHDARRDGYILRPFDVVGADGSVQHYEPLVWRSQKKNGRRDPADRPVQAHRG